MVNQSPLIYHVTTSANWEKALLDKEYLAASVAIEGFMHACSLNQLPGVLSRYYKGHSDLIRLTIDVSKLKAELKYEFASSVNEYFPHVYGSVPIEAIIEAHPITF